MEPITIAVAVRALGRPLDQLADAGKSFFAERMEKWKAGTARKQLAQKIVAMEKVKTFWQRDKGIPISKFYYPNKVAFRTGKPFAVPNLSALPQDENLVIQGTIGQGKSIFIRHLCVQELTDNGTGRIPVLVELRALTTDGLEQAIRSALEALGFELSDALFAFYMRTGKLVVLLDAFDEIDETLVSAVVSELERLIETYEMTQFIITARPQSAIEGSRHVQIAKLCPLRKDDHLPFLRRIGLTVAEANRLIAAVRAGSSQIVQLLSTPLILTLLVVVYHSEQTIPQELPEFYQKLFQTLFSKHDSAKPGFKRQHKSGLSERRLQQLFRAFCFTALQLRMKTVLSQDEFNRCFDKALKYVDFTTEAEAFRHDIVKVACLMQEEGYELQFLHKSVLEFFAAEFIAERTEEGAKRFYEQLIGGAWYPWNQTLSFLSQIDRYRYLKYFEIPCVTAMLAELGIDEEVGEDQLALTRKVLGDFSIRLRKSLINSPFATIVASPTEAFQPVQTCEGQGSR